MVERVTTAGARADTVGDAEQRHKPELPAGPLAHRQGLSGRRKESVGLWVGPALKLEMGSEAERISSVAKQRAKTRPI